MQALYDSAQPLEPCDRVDLFPAILAVADVSAHNANPVAHHRKGELRRESGASELRFGLLGLVLADCLGWHEGAFGEQALAVEVGTRVLCRAVEVRCFLDSSPGA